MALEDSVKAISHVARVGLYATPIEHGIEVAGAAWIRGAILVNSAGSLAEIGELPTTVAGLIVGVALVDATGVTGTNVDYIPALPHLTFEASLEDQANGDHALVQADVFAAYGIETTATTGGIYYLNENVTTAADVVARVIRLVDPVATVQGRVRFHFIADATIYGT